MSRTAVALGFVLMVLVGGLHANTVWDESVDGDLSNNANAPTPLAFGVGSNVVVGSMGAPNDPREFLTFSIQNGQSLVSLWLMRYEDLLVGGPGNTGFHAINAGPTSFIPGAGTAGNFLGGDHVHGSQVGSDLLPLLAAAPLAGTGFTIPVGPGTYSYIIQQTGPDLTGYTLDFRVVPEPSSAMRMLIGILALPAALRRAKETAVA